MGTVVNGFDVTGCVQAAAAIEAEIKKLAASVSEAEFHAPARDGGWSVGYCIEHLVLTGRAFLPKWDTALQTAGANGARSMVPYGWCERRVLYWVEDPAKLKRKTSPPFVPYSRYSAEETVSRFLTMHQELVRRVTSSHGRDVRRTKVQSPFFSWLWYALGFSFDLALAHERRHLSQAWRVRQQLIGA